jgi:hypothetical protein
MPNHSRMSKAWNRNISRSSAGSSSRRFSATLGFFYPFFNSTFTILVISILLGVVSLCVSLSDEVAAEGHSFVYLLLIGVMLEQPIPLIKNILMLTRNLMSSTDGLAAWIDGPVHWSLTLSGIPNSYSLPSSLRLFLVPFQYQTESMGMVKRSSLSCSYHWSLSAIAIGL